MTGIARTVVIGAAYGVALVVGCYCYARGGLLKLRDRVRI